MRYFAIAILAAIMFGQILPVAAAELSPVVITEIAAYEPSGHEWIEIYNRSAAPVDLTKWKFFEDNANHGLTLFRGENMILAPQTYVVIAQVAATTATDYPAYTGPIIDSAWSSLKEAGESVGLKDASGGVVELFTYLPTEQFSIERIDPLLDDYTAANWQEHWASNSLGQATAAPPADEVLVDEDVAPAEELSIPLTCDPDVVINEFVADPVSGESEWVELYNRGSDSVILDGWSLTDGSERVTVLSGGILPWGWTTITKPKGSLNNTGDQITLWCNDGFVDRLTYGNWDDGLLTDNLPTAADPWSVARLTDGGVDWAVTTTPTPSTTNIINSPPAPETKIKTPVIESNDDDETEALSSVVAPSGLAGEATVRLSELFPNPTGVDTTDEFIELWNYGSADTSLVGWVVADGAGQFRFTAEDKLAAGEYRAFFRSTTRLALNNSGTETVTLYRDGAAVDVVAYSGTVNEGSSYQHLADDWQWSATATPHAAAMMTAVNYPPTAAMTITKPRRTEVGEVVNFDATDSADQSGDQLTYHWDFGDGMTGSGLAADHAYQAAQSYTAILTVTDAGGLSDRVKKKFTIYPPDVEAAVAGKSKTANQERPTSANPSSAVLGAKVIAADDPPSPVVGWGLTIGALVMIGFVKRQSLMAWAQRQGQLVKRWRSRKSEST